MRRMANPADSPPPPARSRWHDWWKIPVFFGLLAAVVAVLSFQGTGGLLLLLLAYLLVRAVVTAVALVRKRRKR